MDNKDNKQNKENNKNSTTTIKDNQKVLTFENVSYKIIEKQAKNKLKIEKDNKIEQTEKLQQKETILLNNVNGFALSSEILSIVGSSGSGKSTLLDCIVDRNSTDTKYEMTRNVFNYIINN